MYDPPIMGGFARRRRFSLVISQLQHEPRLRCVFEG